MTLVKFKSDIYPYCTGDIVKIEGEEKKKIDETIESRGVEGYEIVSTKADSKKEDADATKTDTKADSKK